MTTIESFENFFKQHFLTSDFFNKNTVINDIQEKTIEVLKQDKSNKKQIKSKRQTGLSTLLYGKAIYNLLYLNNHNSLFITNNEKMLEYNMRNIRYLYDEISKKIRPNGI
jgi:hypothetical protein